MEIYLSIFKVAYLQQLCSHQFLTQIISTLDNGREQAPVGEMAIGRGFTYELFLLVPRFLHRETKKNIIYSSTDTSRLGAQTFRAAAEGSSGSLLKDLVFSQFRLLQCRVRTSPMLNTTGGPKRVDTELAKVSLLFGKCLLTLISRVTRVQGHLGDGIAFAVLAHGQILRCDLIVFL